MCRSGKTIDTPVLTAFVRIDRLSKGYVGRLVCRDEFLGLIKKKLGSWWTVIGSRITPPAIVRQFRSNPYVSTLRVADATTTFDWLRGLRRTCWVQTFTGHLRCPIHPATHFSNVNCIYIQLTLRI